MLAVSGYVVAEIARFPGAVTLDGLQFKDVPNGLAAITAIPGEIRICIFIYLYDSFHNAIESKVLSHIFILVLY
jgi:hypothetical protein